MQSPHSAVFNASVTKPVFGATGGPGSEHGWEGFAMCNSTCIFLISIQLD